MENFSALDPDDAHWTSIEDLLKALDELSVALRSRRVIDEDQELLEHEEEVQLFLSKVWGDLPKPDEEGCLELDYMQLERLVQKKTLGSLE